MRAKLDQPQSRLRTELDASWWVYVISDAIVDSVFDMAQSIGSRFAQIEREMLLELPKKEHIPEVRFPCFVLFGYLGCFLRDYSLHGYDKISINFPIPGDFVKK